MDDAPHSRGLHAGPIPAGLDEALRDLVPLDAEILGDRPGGRAATARWLLRADRVPALVGALSADHGVLVAGGARVLGEERLHLDTPDLRGLVEAARGQVPRHELRLRREGELDRTFLEVETRLPGGLRTVRRRAHTGWTLALAAQETAWALDAAGWEGDALVPAARSWAATVTLVQLEGLGRAVIELGLRFDRPPLTRRLPAAALVALEAEAAHSSSAASRALRAAGARRHGAGLHGLALGLLALGEGAGRLGPALRAVEALQACSGEAARYRFFAGAAAPLPGGGCTSGILR